MFNLPSQRLYLPAGLYGQSLNALALNLPNAAAASRLKLDIYVKSSAFVATESTLAKIDSIAALQAVTGLDLHQGAGYAFRLITAVSVETVDPDTSDKVVFTPTPTSYSWLALGAATGGFDLAALVVRYDNGAGIDIPVYWYNGGGIVGTPMLGGDVNLSLPTIDAVRSLAT